MIFDRDIRELETILAGTEHVFVWVGQVVVIKKGIYGWCALELVKWWAMYALGVRAIGEGVSEVSGGGVGGIWTTASFA